MPTSPVNSIMPMRTSSGPRRESCRSGEGSITGLSPFCKHRQNSCLSRAASTSALSISVRRALPDRLPHPNTARGAMATRRSRVRHAHDPAPEIANTAFRMTAARSEQSVVLSPGRHPHSLCSLRSLLFPPRRSEVERQPPLSALRLPPSAFPLDTPRVPEPPSRADRSVTHETPKISHELKAVSSCRAPGPRRDPRGH